MESVSHPSTSRISPKYFFYGNLFGANNAIKTAFISFDILICCYSIFFSKHEAMQFCDILFRNPIDAIDFTKVAYCVLSRVLYVVPFPFLIIYIFYEQFTKRMYIFHYLLSLMLLLIPYTFIFYYSYLVVLDKIGMSLLKINACILIIIVSGYFLKIKHKKPDINLFNYRLYVNIALRLSLISLVFLYMHKRYDVMDIDGYLRNEIVNTKDQRTIQNGQVLHSSHFPLERFEKRIAAYDDIETYFYSMLFIRIDDVDIFNSMTVNKKKQAADRLTGIYQCHLSLPLTDFVSIHPYRVVLYLFQENDFSYYCAVDVYSSDFL